MTEGDLALRLLLLLSFTERRGVVSGLSGVTSRLLIAFAFSLAERRGLAAGLGEVAGLPLAFEDGFDGDGCFSPKAHSIQHMTIDRMT